MVEDGETQAAALKRVGLPPDTRGVGHCVGRSAVAIFQRRAYGGPMEFTERMLWKAGAILIMVAVVQFWRGLIGRPARLRATFRRTGGHHYQNQRPATQGN